MLEKKDIKLSDLVQISRHYQRSIKIDIDLGRSDALDGYICHGTSKAVLESMSKQLLESNQRAFTWTGLQATVRTKRAQHVRVLGFR